MPKLNLPDLNKIVLESLDFFTLNQPPKLNTKNFSFGFVVGSVNAYNTGRIMFNNKAVFFADEGNFLEQLKIYRPLIKAGTIKEALVISASGEKDSIWEIKAAKKAGLKTTLMTCEPNSSGAKLADNVLPFQKIAEPYSYNFSTYLGMILSLSKEDPKKIKDFLKKIKIPKNFSSYHYFTFILPDRYRPIVDMINVKDDELFGPYSSLRGFSEGNARHAKFICRSDKELVISFGKNKYFGLAKNRFEINLSKNAGPGLILALSYYIVGLIQGAKPPYFKNDIENYCKVSGAIAYKGKNKFSVIVPGN